MNKTVMTGLTSILLASGCSTVENLRDKVVGKRNIPVTKTQAHYSQDSVTPPVTLLKDAPKRTLDAQFITRENVTYLVETNRYSLPGELNWVFRPADSADIDINGKQAAVSGPYLIPTLRHDLKGFVVNNINVSRQFDSRYKTQDSTEQLSAAGGRVNLAIRNPLTSVRIQGTNYFLPTANEINGTTSMRIIPATETFTVKANGNVYFPAPIYSLNRVQQFNYSLRSTNAVSTPTVTGQGFDIKN